MQQKEDFNKGLIRGQFTSEILLARGKSLLDSSRDKNCDQKSEAIPFTRKIETYPHKQGQDIRKSYISRMDQLDHRTLKAGANFQDSDNGADYLKIIQGHPYKNFINQGNFSKKPISFQDGFLHSTEINTEVRESGYSEDMSPEDFLRGTFDSCISCSMHTIHHAYHIIIYFPQQHHAYIKRCVAFPCLRSITPKNQACIQAKVSFVFLVIQTNP